MVASNRRSQILIEPYKQLRFGLVFILLNVFFSTALVLVFGYYLWDIHEAVSEYFKLDTAQTLAAAGKLAKPFGIGVSLIVLFIFSTLYFSAHYTHQIYGPLVSIRRYLDDIIAGKRPADIRLRSSDQLHDVVARLNLLSEQLAVVRMSASREQVQRFLDDVLAGREPGALQLPAGDPLQAIADKLNQVIKSGTSKH